LIPSIKPNVFTAQVLHAAFDQLCSHLYKANARDKECYGFINNDAIEILKALGFAVNAHLQKHKLELHPFGFGKPGFRPIIHFLDVGCGYGNVLTLFDSLGWASGFWPESYGIENDPEIFNNISPRVIKNKTIELIDGRVFTNYPKYDIIYRYVPIMAANKMAELDAAIAHYARIGAYIITFGSEDNYNDRRFKPIADHIYEKVHAQS